MFYHQNSSFYPYPGLFYVLPPVIPLQYFQLSPFETKQTASQQEKKQLSFKLEQIQPYQNPIPLIGKPQDSKQRKNQTDSDYEPNSKEILTSYKKKNTESNLSNQIFSYISSNRSTHILLKIFDQNTQKVEQFYKLLKKIRKSNKKYMNRSYLIELVQLKTENTNFKIYKRCKCPLQIQEVRRAIKISIKHFFEKVCDVGLLTSKKMNKMTLMEHFSRKRDIREYLFSKFQGQN